MPRILQVTGAYHPEISAAAVQCRAVAAALRGRARFEVLTTAVDRAIDPTGVVDDTLVTRVRIDVTSRVSRAGALARFAAELLRLGRTCDIIHLHGFSQKALPTWAVARLLRKPYLLSLHTAGQDEPAVVKKRGALAYRAFMSADLILSVSPYMTAQFVAVDRDSGRRDGGRVRLTPNGVDTNRFRPATAVERNDLRRELGWPIDQRVVVFIGFFSRDKRPDLLFRAWRRVVADSRRARLVYVGATGGPYYEIDRSLAEWIRREAVALGRSSDVAFIDPTADVDRCLRAADLFVLPSVRESQSMALLEAMACGLPSIATCLPGATDQLIADGVNGRLVAPDNETEFAAAMCDILNDPAKGAAFGSRARETVLSRYDVRDSAERWLAAYHEALNLAA